MSTPVRMPAVAGHFYPAKPQALEREIANYTHPSAEKLSALGCIVPHAGYMYSGHVAGAVYSRLELPRRYIIMCPNHTGMGEPLAIMSDGDWLTPLGKARIDHDRAASLKRHCNLLAEDEDAHLREHALEVQLPFLQKLVPDFSFVPIAVGTGRYEALEALGAAIAETLAETGDRILVVASSDMNHYESDQITRIKDRRALDRILALDPRGLYDVVTTQHITMCGFGPAVSMLTACKLRGATRAELVKYATSGDINNDRTAVVGYAGVAVM
ncbi:MAG: AmmeMemoRadiSam system protein B [Terriglobales bacterium]